MFRSLLLALVVGGCMPPMPPVPIDPVPPSPVDPVPDDSDVSAIRSGTWLVVIEETANRNPADPRTKIIQDTAFWVTLRSSGVSFQISDQNDLQVSPYVAMLNGATLPALFVLDKTGKVLSRGQMPASKAAIVTLAARVTR